MPDPLSLVALGAAVGGVAGKFVEKAWDSGERWLSSYFADHQEIAQERARLNAAQFLKQLAGELDTASRNHELNSPAIQDAQSHPEFSATLQKALLTAAQTDSDVKHRLLARVISERLEAGSESTLAVASKMACDAVAFATSTQLQVLGLQAILLVIVPKQDLTGEEFVRWLDAKLKPYRQIAIHGMDLLHLEAISCVRIEQHMQRNLVPLMRSKYGWTRAEFNGPKVAEVLAPFNRHWDGLGLQTVNLTSVGQIIGIYVADLLSGTRTTLVRWGA